MIYMVCYDVSDPKRLQKTAKVLENFGLRVQKSFFQCEISEKGMQKLRNQLLKVLNTEKDYFYIYPLCGGCTQKAQSDGNGQLIRLESFEIY